MPGSWCLESGGAAFQTIPILWEKSTACVRGLCKYLCSFLCFRACLARKSFRKIVQNVKKYYTANPPVMQAQIHIILIFF